MNVNIQTVRFTADSKLLDYVSEKLQKFNTFMTVLSKLMYSSNSITWSTTSRTRSLKSESRYLATSSL